MNQNLKNWTQINKKTIRSVLATALIMCIFISSFFGGGYLFCDMGGGTLVKGVGCVDFKEVKYCDCDGKKFPYVDPFDLNLTSGI